MVVVVFDEQDREARRVDLGGRLLEQVQPVGAQHQLARFDQLEHEVDDLGIPLLAAPLLELVDDLIARARLPVELPGRHDFDRVGDGDDASAERDGG